MITIALSMLFEPKTQQRPSVDCQTYPNVCVCVCVFMWIIRTQICIMTQVLQGEGDFFIFLYSIKTTGPRKP